ncbi:hypothetical protein [Flavobacterium poyangense]|uniref:hypothetical protein n=1 Tax=Flavobacterium poyangense TaxID=2204302 RepID=UPI001421D703|nr:hypothetical protein [Flavobacterium sp. JXAS1]
MKRKITVFCFLCLFIIQINAQDGNQNVVSSELNTSGTSYLVKDYPQGVYPTLDDLLQKKGINMGDAIERKLVFGRKSNAIPKDVVANQVYFYFKRDSVMVNKYDAISYNGNLYIQQRLIKKLAAKKDKNQEGNDLNSYHRVINDGKFWYFEGPYANMWSKAFAYGAGGAVGGAIGSNLGSLKGIVFSLEKKEFNLIRDCEGLNLIIEEYKGTKIECKDKEVSILVVRENIDKIIK